MQRIVGIGGIETSGNPEDVLITYSLGSCVGLTLYDPVAGVGGLAHHMLPFSRIDPEGAIIQPGRFTDTGVPLLLQRLLNMGARRKHLIAKVAGASRLQDQESIFRIGELNHAVLCKILRKNEIAIRAQDVGGTAPRTMRLYVGTGITTIRERGPEREL